VTAPATWLLNSWVSDLVPHLSYGLMTPVAYDALTGV
jgi:hypothetical protein